MKVLIFGHRGQLGSELATTFRNNHEVIGFSSQDVDITDQEAVKRAVDQFKPHCILNAAAYTQVESAESDAAGAYAVNALGAYYIARAAQRCEAALVQISTDYVFDGAQPYFIETDYPRPLNVYGASKLAGEQLVKIACSRHYIVRTSALFGKRHSKQSPNFVDRMLESARQKCDIKMVDDQFTAPTYVVDLAKAIYDLLKKESPFGVYHITNQGSCSWYEFARYIINTVGIISKVRPIRTCESPSFIVRPRSSILISNRKIILPSWQNAIQRYLISNCILHP